MTEIPNVTRRSSGTGCASFGAARFIVGDEPNLNKNLALLSQGRGWLRLVANRDRRPAKTFCFDSDPGIVQVGVIDGSRVTRALGELMFNGDQTLGAGELPKFSRQFVHVIRGEAIPSIRECFGIAHGRTPEHHDLSIFDWHLPNSIEDKDPHRQPNGSIGCPSRLRNENRNEDANNDRHHDPLDNRHLR